MSLIDLWKKMGGVVTYSGDDPTTNYSKLRDRLKTAADKIQPGLGSELGSSSGVVVRARVNEITGANITNGPLERCMEEMAIAMERHADLSRGRAKT